MIKNILLGFLTMLTFASVAPVAQAAPGTLPITSMAATCPGRFLTLPAWYRGLQGDTACNPKLAKLTDLWIIALNIVEMMMHAVVYVAAGFTMWGGFRYLLANGEPDKISSAKNTITYALTGAGISVVAIAAINFIVAQAL